MENNEKERAERTRIQLELSPGMCAKLEQLVDATGLSTRADVLRRAISVFAVLVEEERAGNKIEIVGNGTRQRLLIA